jgi:hypothetical protein
MSECVANLITHAAILVVLSVLYAVAFELVFVVSDAIQRFAYLDFGYGSILFFPHGIRVLAAYLFGWRSVAYLLPVSLWYMDMDASGLALLSSIVLSMGSLVAVVIAFELLKPLKFTSHRYWEVPLHPVALLVAGSMGAIFNAFVHVGLGIVDGMKAASGLFFGDLLGLVSVLLTYALIAAVLRKVV